MKDHIETITDLLLGAAHADQEFVGHEVVTIRSIVSKMYGQRTLPPERVEQIKSFDPATFDHKHSARSLASASKDTRKKILELISMVIEADEIIDLDEDRYLREVAEAMGFDEAEIKAMTLDVDEESDLSEYFED